jgi:hypothetical protein
MRTAVLAGKDDSAAVMMSPTLFLIVCSGSAQLILVGGKLGAGSARLADPIDTPAHDFLLLTAGRPPGADSCQVGPCRRNISSTGSAT